MPLIPNAYTPDTIAIGIIAEGRREGVDDLAIVCSISCGLVESGLQMYANQGDPHTLDYPYQALSRDENSAGIYQQRYPWWDDPSTDDFGGSSDRMDVARSTRMFLKSLLAQRGPNYHEDPGVAVANVQQPNPLYRDRYTDRMGDAWAIFNRLKDVEAHQPGAPTPAIPQRPDFTELERFGEGFNSRSRPPINFFIHTEEDNSTAEQLAAFCDGSNNVSYHYTVRDGIVCDVVDTDYFSWSVLDANVFSINLCFAGSRAAWTREQWLDIGDDIDIAAYLAVQDCTKYTFADDVIAPPYHEAAGVSDHKYVTQCLHIGTHTDVGDSFPWDVFADRINHYANGISGDDDVPLVNQPSGSIYRDSNKNLDWAGTPMDFIMDAQIHEGRVEQLAKDGVPKALALVQAVADGTSPVSDSLSDDARAQAQAILDVIAKPKTVRKPKAS